MTVLLIRTSGGGPASARRDLSTAFNCMIITIAPLAEALSSSTAAAEIDSTADTIELVATDKQPMLAGHFNRH